MSEGIPKSARELLSKQTAADTHPSPDLLNGYVEQSLSEAESSLVLTHLATCAECREVVFLVSAAAPELETSPAAAATTTALRELRPAAIRSASQLQGGAVVKPRPKQTNHWWKWALPLTAIVILGASVLLQRYGDLGLYGPTSNETRSANSKPAEAARSSAPASAASTDRPSRSYEVAVAPPAVEPKAKAQGARKAEEADALADKTQQANRDEATLQARTGAQVSEERENSHSNAAAGAATAPQIAAKASPPPSNTVEVTSAAPLVQADNADLSSNTVQQEMQTQPLAKSLAGNQATGLATLQMQSHKATANTRWRISDDGHVEHTVGPNTWTRVMAAEPVTFHVVSNAGGEVWAGGSDGALFHSSDGRHWTRVALAGEQGTITSIRFNNAQQGSLRTDAGTTWTTTDGGRTWSRQ